MYNHLCLKSVKNSCTKAKINPFRRKKSISIIRIKIMFVFVLKTISSKTNLIL